MAPSPSGKAEVCNTFITRSNRVGASIKKHNASRKGWHFFLDDAMDLLSPYLIVITLLLGAFAGFTAGLLGIGGGVILVPLFLWLFPVAGFPVDLVVHTAFGTSLAIILPTAISSVLAHRKRGNIIWSMVTFLAIGGVLGSILGSSLAAILPGEKLKITFGMMQIAVSLKLFFSRKSQPVENLIPACKWQLLIIIGAIGGFFSAFFGIGGGVVAVPLMFMVLKIPIRSAVGNSSALIVISSFSAVCLYVWYGLDEVQNIPFSFGYVNSLVALIVTPLTMVFARFGVALANRISQDKLVKVFAMLLMLVGLKIIFNF